MGLFNLGNTEWLVILIVALLLFGATAIPKLARSLGQAKGQFQQAKKTFEEEAAKVVAAPSAASTPAGPTDDQLREMARTLGIDPDGKSADELKRLIAQKVA